MNAKDIGKRIQTIRNDKGLTQEDLSELTDFSTTSISNWENGTTNIRKENLIKIADALEVNMLDLMMGEEVEGIDPAIKEEIVKRFNELDDALNDVKNVSIVVEDRGILSAYMGFFAIGMSEIALALGIWAAFDHTVLNTILVSVLGIVGIAFMIFGNKVIKKMESQLKERKEKLK